MHSRSYGPIGKGHSRGFRADVLPEITLTLSFPDQSERRWRWSGDCFPTAVSVGYLQKCPAEHCVHDQRGWHALLPSNCTTV